jgi:protein SCO1/2
MLNKLKLPLFGLTVLLILGLVISLFQAKEPPPLEFDSAMGVPIISPPVPLPEVSLLNQDGQPFTEQQLKGKWNLLFFGYTNCPDICPTTLQTMSLVADELNRDDLNYIFITVDPKRDTVATMKKYVSYFHPDFKGLTGDKAEIDKLTKALGIIYEYDGDIENNDYIVNHYGAILVVDPQARLRAHILPPHPNQKIIDAVETIIDYYGAK